MTSYNPASVARYFDALGAREWTRLVETPTAEVKLHVHSHYLRRYVTPGMRVLDIGAGAGRFTQVLATLGASVTVADLSPVQLSLNKQHAAEHAFAHAVTDWVMADICDLSAFPDEAFDAVVCYGGPLSYVFERRQEALDELRRVTAPGGYLFLSVMCLWGSIHEKLPGVLATDAMENARIIATGELRLGADDGTRHQCHLYRGTRVPGAARSGGLRATGALRIPIACHPAGAHRWTRFGLTRRGGRNFSAWRSRLVRKRAAWTLARTSSPSSGVQWPSTQIDSRCFGTFTTDVRAGSGRVALARCDLTIRCALTGPLRVRATRKVGADLPSTPAPPSSAHVPPTGSCALRCRPRPRSVTAPVGAILRGARTAHWGEPPVHVTTRKNVCHTREAPRGYVDPVLRQVRRFRWAVARLARRLHARRRAVGERGALLSGPEFRRDGRRHAYPPGGVPALGAQDGARSVAAPGVYHTGVTARGRGEDYRRAAGGAARAPGRRSGGTWRCGSSTAAHRLRGQEVALLTDRLASARGLPQEYVTRAGPPRRADRPEADPRLGAGGCTSRHDGPPADDGVSARARFGVFWPDPAMTRADHRPPCAASDSAVSEAGGARMC
jgi:2-polyprenyl-3-methyl-5-hydroxy-6-metoxy-1,4-benzoquinol methylase